jgi:tetratricopeptide (TPR) repeat protein
VRQDYDEALSWYKKSLESDPNFGDAYYNMACIYSLKKKLELAFNYLHIAALDGFVAFEGIEQDPDLANLRSDKRYAEILKEMRKK